MIGKLVEKVATPVGAKAAIAVAGALIGLVITLSVLLWINGSKLDNCRDERAGFKSALDLQNKAVKDWKAEADRRREEARGALEEARAARDARAPQIQILRESARQPKSGPCTTPDTLKGLKL